MNIVEILNHLSDRFFKMRVYDLSAQMAYYFLMSVFPFLLVIYSLMTYLPLNEGNILELIQPYAPDATYALIEKTLSYTVRRQEGNLLSLSLVVTLWLSSMGLQCMKRILNDAYEVRNNENVVKQLFESLMLTIGFMIAVLFSVIVPVFEKVLRVYLDDIFSIVELQRVWIVVQWGIGTIFLLVFFLVLYSFAPSIKLGFRKAVPGAFFATICWQLVSMGFASYVSGSNYSALYGQVASLVVLMLWFYLSAMIIIVGGLLNSVVYPE
ncbi:YihY/virulence factor BrkB family protein [Fictibacillus phosphorivorans]|uniref:YihY/virulence factor BrkB family protein n=1 Tax=Fictibacillus phosphorivorans TaxID=1221500 RepID=UPI00203F9084|nr:YihY/virulence factor BrkB family protein [Fictibacillus phosphorivorans]MCM3717825.1 YihY/virulence factor BrkB family protein [Fictibacillus phosphorivorans]MCM3777053.1 YihY/virulence factor BrkB family protein [Fictibacillus phosphorivorans]